MFLVVDSKARFQPIETALQGELIVEVASGLSEGDVIVTGPFRVLRQLEDDELLEPEEKGKDDEEKSRG